MSHESLHESLQGKDWQDIVFDQAGKIEYLESQIVNFERKLLALKIFIARHFDSSGLCYVCGALPNEQCTGRHG